MKAIFKSASLFVLALGISYTFLEAKQVGLGVGGGLKTEERKTAAFSSVSVSTGIKLFLSQGSVQKIRVEADDNIISELKTEVSGSRLKIYLDNNDHRNYHNIRAMRVYVTCPELNLIESTSGSNVDVDGLWKAKGGFSIESSSGSSVVMNLQAKSFTCESSSGSSIKASIDADKVKLEARSGSSMKISGKGVALKAEASSGSSIDAESLKVETCIAEASSASSLHVNVSRDLQATASSVAKVGYSGNPQKIEKSVSSLGKVSAD